MSQQPIYEEAVRAYVDQASRLFAPPPAVAETEQATRGTRTIQAEPVIQRCEQLTETSQHLGQMTADYLEADARAVREGAEMKLLAQATAEFEIARALFEMAEDEAKGKVVRAATRRSRAATTQRAINELALVLEAPLEEGVDPVLRTRSTRRIAQRPVDIERVKAQLQDEVDKSLRRISQEASKVGGRAMRDLLLMDSAALLRGVALISKDAERLLDQAISGLGGMARRLALAAIRLILHAYDWVLALLGKDTEQRSRAQVKQWLDEAKVGHKGEQDSDEFLTRLIDRIYGSQTTGGEIKGWIAASQASADKLTDTATDVAGLADRYQAKAHQVERLLRAVALGKRVPVMTTPQGQIVAAAVTLGLLGYVLYSGYDHVDSGSATSASLFGFALPDRVEGVRETAEKALIVSAMDAESESSE